MHNNVNCGHPSGGMTKVIEVKVLKLGKVRSARKRKGCNLESEFYDGRNAVSPESEPKERWYGVQKRYSASRSKIQEAEVRIKYNEHGKVKI